MKISLISPAHKLPEWQQQGFVHYAKRLRHPWSLNVLEPAIVKRQRHGAMQTIKQQEAANIQALVPRGACTIALDQHGESLNSETLAKKLAALQQHHSRLCLLVGGPDGLDAQLMKDCSQVWSLSPCVFPHGLVRVIVAEQLYRAIAQLQNHPYHRQ